ncbi:hypothetical protein C2E23DRAFT_900769 [Lenzites betulinus]|nr:hypothetical protein C2E23DRAFT_900769 [Lenzites betulinus]
MAYQKVLIAKLESPLPEIVTDSEAGYLSPIDGEFGGLSHKLVYSTESTDEDFPPPPAEDVSQPAPANETYDGALNPSTPPSNGGALRLFSRGEEYHSVVLEDADFDELGSLDDFEEEHTQGDADEPYTPILEILEPTLPRRLHFSYLLPEYQGPEPFVLAEGPHILRSSSPPDFWGAFPLPVPQHPHPANSAPPHLILSEPNLMQYASSTDNVVLQIMADIDAELERWRGTCHDFFIPPEEYVGDIDVDSSLPTARTRRIERQQERVRRRGVKSCIYKGSRVFPA